jgi:hypothetical protein
METTYQNHHHNFFELALLLFLDLFEISFILIILYHQIPIQAKLYGPSVWLDFVILHYLYIFLINSLQLI